VNPDEHNPIASTLGSGTAGAVMLWAAFGIYTSFFHGTAPLIPWQTSHNVIFGLVWLFFVFPAVLTQARTARNCFLAVAVWNHGWSLLPLAVGNLLIQVYGSLLIALAWFPSPLPSPLSGLSGGISAGIIILLISVGVLLACNLAVAGYMKWVFREQHAQYVEVVGKRVGQVTSPEVLISNASPKRL
jgi:hypothetical protein